MGKCLANHQVSKSQLANHQVSKSQFRHINRRYPHGFTNTVYRRTQKGPKIADFTTSWVSFFIPPSSQQPRAKWLPIFSCCFFSQPRQIHVMWGDSTKSSLSADSSSALQTDRRTDRQTDRQTDRRKCDLNSGASTTKRLIKTDECLLLLSSCIWSRSKRDTCRCGALWITPNAPTETSTNNNNNNNNKFK